MTTMHRLPLGKAATAAALTVFIVALTAAAATGQQPAPYLLVYPEMPAPGATVTAYGRDFCTAASCSAVTITLDNQPVATIDVTPDGTFAAPFEIDRGPGRYAVVATQTTADGGTL